MAIPNAKFTTDIHGLTVYFTDTSNHTPTSWLWAFGDGDTSVQQNPIHTYAAAGDYTVQLIATNADGSSTPYSLEITVEDGSYNIAQTHVIEHESPIGITIPAIEIEHSVSYWRYMMKDNLDLEDADIEKEVSWPYLWKILIARLVIRDYVLKLYQSHLVRLSGTGEGNDGNVKKVETGPASVELHDSMGSFKNLFQVNKNGVTPFDQVFIGVCEIAGKLQVHLDCCTPKSFKPIIPQKVEFPET